MKQYICTCCGSVSAIEKADDLPIDGDVSSQDSLDVLLCKTCTPIDEQTLRSVHNIPASTPVVALETSNAFNGLSDTEKLYAYWIGRASWEGALICLAQTSPESIPIFCMLLSIFKQQSVSVIADRAVAAGLTRAEIDNILMYAAAFFSNMGNYKSLGDTKFVPQVSLDTFRAFLRCASSDPLVYEGYLTASLPRLYSLSSRHRQVCLTIPNFIYVLSICTCVTNARLG